eukprot:30464-Pleurochrysis_carterae.AAC.2
MFHELLRFNVITAVHLAAGAPDDASSSCAPSGRMNGAAQSHEDGPPSKRRAVDTSANDTPSATSPPEGTRPAHVNTKETY